MKIIMGKDIKVCFDSSSDFRKAIKIAQEDLTHDNPNTRSYANFQKYPKNFCDKIFSYDICDKKNMIIIPRGSGDTLRKMIKGLNLKINKDTIIDQTTKGYKISFKHKFTPRDNLQVEAIDSFVRSKKKHLILQGGCGLI